MWVCNVKPSQNSNYKIEAEESINRSHLRRIFFKRGIHLIEVAYSVPRLNCAFWEEDDHIMFSILDRSVPSYINHGSAVWNVGNEIDEPHYHWDIDLFRDREEEGVNDLVVSAAFRAIYNVYGL